LNLVVTDKTAEIIGEYDFVSSTNVTLAEIASHYNKNVTFGNFTYETNLSKILEKNNLHPCKTRTSLETIELFLEEMK